MGDEELAAGVSTVTKNGNPTCIPWIINFWNYIVNKPLNTLLDKPLDMLIPFLLIGTGHTGQVDAAYLNGRNVSFLKLIKTIKKIQTKKEKMAA